MSLTSVKCIAPWRALCIKADGSVVPDIQFRSSFGNIHQKTLSEILLNPALKTLRSHHKMQSFDKSCINCEKKRGLRGPIAPNIFF